MHQIPTTTTTTKILNKKWSLQRSNTIEQKESYFYFVRFLWCQTVPLPYVRTKVDCGAAPLRQYDLLNKHTRTHTRYHSADKIRSARTTEHKLKAVSVWHLEQSAVNFSFRALWLCVPWCWLTERKWFDLLFILCKIRDNTDTHNCVMPKGNRNHEYVSWNNGIDVRTLKHYREIGDEENTALCLKINCAYVRQATRRTHR